MKLDPALLRQLADKVGTPFWLYDAAVLRQRGADLVSALAREGLECTAIKVVVQPRPTAGVDRKTKAIQWDESASRALASLCGSLPDGPLKAAVGRLLRRH